VTKRRLIVYFANRFENAQLDATDPTYLVEMLEDAKGQPVDLLLETIGGYTDTAERVVSILENMAPDLRVVVAGAAKSNGTVICLAGKSIVLGASSELGPIEPQLNVFGGLIPSTILAMQDFAAQNFIVHHLAKFAIEQTKKLAKRLLENGMKKGASDTEIEELIKKLLTRETKSGEELDEALVHVGAGRRDRGRQRVEAHANERGWRNGHIVFDQEYGAVVAEFFIYAQQSRSFSKGRDLMFGISSGFRRLSILVAVIGLIYELFIFGVPTSIAVFGGTMTLIVSYAFFFARLPALFVLLLGWVVAGFRKSH
jgi:hypothetical protein